MNIVEPTKESIFGRARHIKAEIEQIFLDVAHWNDSHPAHEHVEADPGGKMRRSLDSINKMLETA